MYITVDRTGIALVSKKQYTYVPLHKTTFVRVNMQRPRKTSKAGVCQQNTASKKSRFHSKC